MHARVVALTAAAGLIAAGLFTAAPAVAAPATLWAYPAGSDSAVGCPDSATPADQCSLGTALARAEPGDTVELADGAHPYVGNWTVGTAGTPTTAAAITIEGAPDISLVPVLDGNHGSSTGCTTASCSSSILTIAGGTSVTIQRLHFTDANSTGNSAGAIDIGNGMSGGHLTVRNSTFDHNAAADGGGAISAGYNGSATVSVSDSTFDHNSAYDGGAVSVGPSSLSSTLSVSKSVFDDNVADSDDGSGGAISLLGLAASTSAPDVVTDSTFRRNSAQEGGAIAPFGAINLLVADSTFDANTATSGGGAVYVEPLDRIATSSLLRSTFHNDRVTRPSPGTASDELASDGGLVVAGDLFAGTCMLPPGTSVDDGHNAGIDSSCLDKGSGDVVSAAVGSKLATLTTNRKSATQTIAITAGNPAIGAVPSGATAPHAPAAYRALCPRTDQTGYKTPTGSACDAGAVDLAAPLKPTITVSGSRAVAHGSKHTITGHTRPGATVTLYGGGTRLATTTATSTGAFGFARTLTATTRFTANADHQNSATLTLTVITLTLNPARTPLKKGTHTLTGHAPSGRSVTLLRDGHPLARTTATAKNGYAFKVLIAATHRFQVSCDGITTKSTTIHIESGKTGA